MAPLKGPLVCDMISLLDDYHTLLHRWPLVYTDHMRGNKRLIIKGEPLIIVDGVG